MKTLFIDTSNNTKTIVGLEIDGSRDSLERPLQPREGQTVLELMDELFKKHTITVRDIEAISVHVGSGSFTGLRVGVAIANTLADILKIPINGGKPGEAVYPRYT